MNSRDNQRGGIVIFAVIGVLLAGLLAGALYMGKQQVELAKKDAPAPIAIDTEKEASETAKGTSATETPKKEAENKPAASPTKPSPQTQTPATPATPSPTAPVAPRVATVPNSGPSEPLPSTGPADTFLGIGIVMIVSFIGLVFVQSALRLRRSALSR